MKSKLPANFLISLKKGSVKISENKKPAIEFSTKNDDRVVNIISMPVKISGKKSAIKRLADARDLAKILKKRTRWILSYNDVPEVRKLYRDFRKIKLSWSYGMSGVESRKEKHSNEILILSKDI